MLTPAELTIPDYLRNLTLMMLVIRLCVTAGNAGGRIKCGTIVTPEVVVTPASTPADPTADGGADDSAAARASSIAWAAIIGAVSVLATMIL